MQKTKRIISLILAILIAFGSLSWLLTLLVSAAGSSDVWYTLELVYNGIRYKEEAEGASAESSSAVRYIRGSNVKNDYVISSGRAANLTFTVVDKDISGSEADMLAWATAMKADVKVSIDAGSFKAARFDNAKNQTEYIIIDNVSPAPAEGSNYYLTYQVEINGAVYNGTGNTLGFTVESASKKYSKSFSAEITQCQPTQPRNRDDDDDDDDEDKIHAATPYVIVSSYNYGGGQVTAGDVFDLTINFYNTSETIDVENMVMTITTPDAFSLTSSSNTFYISDLEAQQTLSKKVSVQAKPSAKPESHAIEVSFRYQYIADGTRKDGDTKESIAIPVVQLDRFSVDPIEMQNQMFVGEEIPVTVNMVNKGRSEVYNISGEIRGNIANPGQRQNLGNLESGKSESMDFYITCTEPGWVNGEVIITYEDVNMVVKTVSVPYSIEVLSFDDVNGPEPGWEEPGMEVPPEEGQNNKLGIIIAVVAGVVTAAGVLLVIRKKKMASMAASEEEDEEF